MQAFLNLQAQVLNSLEKIVLSVGDVVNDVLNETESSVQKEKHT